MKKVILFFAIVSLLFHTTVLTGCVRNAKLQIARDVAQDIMDCFINKDEETLFSLLSPDAQEFHLTKEQIQEAFDFIDGEIISYDLPTDTGGGGKSIDGRRVISENMTPWIENIITNSKKMYRITFNYRLILESDKNAKGVRDIFISLIDDENGKFIERMAIGIELEPEDRTRQT